MKTRIKTTAVALLAAALTATPVLAQDYYDLIGARAAGGETQLRQRGWWPGRVQTGSSQTIAYWGRNDDCIQVITRDGQYRAITSVSRNFCSGYGPGSGSTSGGTSASAAVAGVAILGLAAAIAAHNHDRHNERDRDHDREYERGYQAGLYGSNYDDRHETEGYHEGYLAGEAEGGNRRHANSSWIRGVPSDAQDACGRAADEFQNRPYGSSVTIASRDLGRGEYELTMGTGSYRSRCTVSASGDVRSMNPY